MELIEKVLAREETAFVVVKVDVVVEIMDFCVASKMVECVLVQIEDKK